MNQNLINTFSIFLDGRGYAEGTIQKYSKALEAVSDSWDTDDPSVLYEHINSTLKLLESNLTTASNYNNIRSAAKQFFLSRTGIIYKEYTHQINNQSSCSYILNDFMTYSIDFKGVLPNTAKSECQQIKQFLGYLENPTYDSLSELKAHDLRDYVCSEFKHLKPSSIGKYVTSLRNLFRFLDYKGYSVNKSILELPLAPADWAKGKVPVVLSKAEEKRLRNHHPRNNKNSKRNRIIILLMLDLGMRCSEVASLKLSDISWCKGTIKIHNTKNGYVRELPLPDYLAQMLEIYILHERPKLKLNSLFIRKYLQDFVPLNVGCVRRIIREAFQKEGISGWWKGTHALRRTAASRIFNSGAGIKITADFLGHKSIDSTMAYLKVDFDSLRSVAASWPGGDSNE